MIEEASVHFKQRRGSVLIQIVDNKIWRWSEVEKLANLGSLKRVALKGNPIEAEDPANYHAKALRALPQVEDL